MASTYSTNLRVELMANGENSTTWGSKTNVNLNLLEQAISGVASVAMTDADYTLTTSNALADEARNAVVTMTGTLTQARNVIVPSVDKQYVFKNSTTGGFSIVVKTSGGTGVTIPNGETVQVYCDATNVEVAATAVGKIRFTQPANGATLTILDGKTLTANHSLTLAGTDGTVMTFPATNATLARTDAANTFTGIQDFDGRIDANAGLAVTGANFTSRGITDSATALALTLSGSGANSITIANSVTNPTIGTSAGDLVVSPADGTLQLSGATTNVLSVSSNTTGNAVLNLGNASSGLRGQIVAANTGAVSYLTFGTASHDFYTGGNTPTLQITVSHTASADRYIILTGSNGSSPVIGTSAGSLLLSPGGAPGLAVIAVASGVNYISAVGSISGGGAVSVSAAGNDTNLAFNIAPKGAGNIGLYGATVPQVVVTPTASADRYITLTGSAGGNPTIGTSAGALQVSSGAAAGATNYIYTLSNLNGSTPALASAIGVMIGANISAGNSEVNFINSSYTAGVSFDFRQVTSSGVSASLLRLVPVASGARYIDLTQATAAGNPKIAASAGSLDIGSAVVFTSQTVGTTVGAAGGASALPATPLGYLTTSVNGSACKIPYYN